ncbi:MAG: glutamate--tRNA ligase [Ardenticatenaceae bacterium]|nr:glutamate--tRNA ligase [Anaerolineales bacterium]MCB8918532.1 glutamate--tRNA ligase [Ardenticatenaceae bacterium]
MTVRVRFAPSPTGYLHIGSVWTALFTWMYARRHNGQFILRIEDTDTRRTVPGALENLMDGLRWFGIEWDEGPDIGGPYGPYTQTERAPLYQQWAHWLVDNGYAYKCFATAEELAEMRVLLEARGDHSGYDRRYRDYPPEKVAALEAAGHPYVIRFKMPLDGTSVVPDLLRGDVVFENVQLTDFVLLKSNGLPTYHLAVVVDDHFMKISHVTRGIEWLSTAPLHVQLYKAFGWEMPVWVHLPVILSPSGRGKLSKRTQAFLDSGEKVLVRADEFTRAGYLRDALVNFLVNVGWSFGDDREKFTIEEAIARFDLAAISPAPVKLPYAKLDWLNGQYIQEMPPAALAKAVAPFLAAAGYTVDTAALLPLMPAMSVRLKRLTDAVDFLRFLYEKAPLPPAGEVTDKRLPPAGALAAFTAARNFVQTVQPYDYDQLQAGLNAIGEANTTNGKAGPFLGKMRLAITRQQVSPPLFESMLALGRAESAARLDDVVIALEQLALTP